MKKTGYLAIGVLVLMIAYLALWPVPVDPVAWTPPEAPPMEGVYAPNAYLAGIERIAVPEGGVGPEDVTVDSLGRIYAGLEDGRIMRYQPDGSGEEVFVHTGGRPLGLEIDASGNLIVADANAGLLSVSPEGTLTTLTTEADGLRLGFTDDLDIGPDGVIYFTDASSKFPIHEFSYDIVENRPHGRLMAYDPATGTTRVLLDDLHFANGVAVSPDGAYLLVNETARFLIQRYWLAGPKAGTKELFVDNLPAYPDGVSSDGEGTFWVAMISPRNPVLDRLSPWPSLRKMLLRLPNFLRPAPEPYAFVLGFD